jgi:uncharacterized protein (DUF433 family)
MTSAYHTEWADCIHENYSLNYDGDHEGDLMITLDRITQKPEVMGGKACIRGMRVTVGMILGQLGAGHTIEEILKDYPYLEHEDILQAMRYGAYLAEEREINLGNS